MNITAIIEELTTERRRISEELERLGSQDARICEAIGNLNPLLANGNGANGNGSTHLAEGVPGESLSPEWIRQMQWIPTSNNPFRVTKKNGRIKSGDMTRAVTHILTQAPNSSLREIARRAWHYGVGGSLRDRENRIGVCLSKLRHQGKAVLASGKYRLT